MIGLTPAFLALPVAALGLGLAVALGLPHIPPAPQAARGRILDLVRERDFWLLAVGFAFVGMLAQVAVLSLDADVSPPGPRIRRRRGGCSSTGIVVTGLMLFSPLFGILSDRLTARRPVMLVGCLLALAGFVVLLVTRHPWVAVGAALMVSASMAATIPMQVVFASERLAVGAGTAIGLVNTGGQIAASLGGPLYGTFLDRGLGFGMVWAWPRRSASSVSWRCWASASGPRAADPSASQP